MILSLYICTLIDGGRIAELRARIAKLEAVAPHLEVGVKP
jgi:hypothetical protein